MLLRSRLRIRVLNCLRLAADLSLLGIGYNCFSFFYIITEILLLVSMVIMIHIFYQKQNVYNMETFLITLIVYCAILYYLRRSASFFLIDNRHNLFFVWYCDRITLCFLEEVLFEAVLYKKGFYLSYNYTYRSN